MKTKTFLPVLALIATLSLFSCKDAAQKDMPENSEKKEMAILSEEETTTAYGYTIGDEANDFNLKNVDGSMVSLSDYPNAKGFIVIFTCNTCPFAMASEDRIVALDQEFKEKGYPVMAINPNNPEVQPDDTFDKMQQKADEAGFTFPYLFDESQTVHAKYGATKTPNVYLLQKEDGKNIVKYIGAIDDNVRNADAVNERFLANAVNELLAGKEVTTKETKAIGCSVKQ
ncbi:thioredoxin family protein [Salegentibacter sp. F188]|uniref:Thioredoxin family protein n=1 Tax=Autumnicola patrickiae TaxID=3075591 RepID=A0ABU3E3Y3_9FLAO|nr:thioredoxin family protein [Salegentibacter sp. F188]MDT0690613.1 thioredoxin family protein [Salegentibacter sp. F188]